MRRPFHAATAATLLASALLLTAAHAQTPAVPPAIAAAIADGSRPATDTARDTNRKPAETLAFIGVKPGDRIVTNGGIYGTVVGVTDSLVQLRIADQVKIEIAKHAVAGLQERAE